MRTEHSINIWLSDSLLWSAQSFRAGHHFLDTDPIILPHTVCSNDDHDDKCSSIILQEDIGQLCWLELVIKKKVFLKVVCPVRLSIHSAYTDHTRM